MVLLRCLVCKNLNWIKSYNKILVKIFIFSCLKMPHFRSNLPKWVLTPQKENSCHIFKMPTFSKLFGCFMAHIIRQNAGETIKYFFEFFNYKDFQFTFVSLFMHKSIFAINQFGIQNYPDFKDPCHYVNAQTIKCLFWCLSFSVVFDLIFVRSKLWNSLV